MNDTWSHFNTAPRRANMLNRCHIPISLDTTLNRLPCRQTGLVSRCARPFAVAQYGAGHRSAVAVSWARVANLSEVPMRPSVSVYSSPAVLRSRAEVLISIRHEDWSGSGLHILAGRELIQRMARGNRAGFADADYISQDWKARGRSGCDRKLPWGHRLALDDGGRQAWFR